MRAFLLITLSLLFSVGVFSQQYIPLTKSMGSYDAPEYITPSAPEVRFVDKNSFLQGDTLTVRFDVTVQGHVIHSGEALHLLPVYKEGNREIRLPAILINGKKRASYYRREQAFLSHQEYWSQRPYATFTHDKRKVQAVSYTFSQKLEAGMQGDGELFVAQVIEDCCDYRLVGNQPMSIDVSDFILQAQVPPPVKVEPTPVAKPEPQPEPQPQRVVPVQAPFNASPLVSRLTESNVTFIRPKKEVVKERNEFLTLRINYKVDKYDVEPYYANNARELQKVDELFRPLSSKRETYTITSVSIKGFASPEAPFQYNLTLSQRRADGFKQYLANRYGLSHLPHFVALGMGEDWNGLRQAVAQSHMPHRQEALSIIDHVGIFEGREKMLMDLAGGVPYRYMLKTLYPPLRRMEMEVGYTVRSFELVEAEQIIDERPQDLSQEEIYQVARRRNTERTVQTNRANYGREYDVAAKYFPSDATANINAGSAALVRGDLELAWKYLSKVQEVPKAYNNLGVYYWMQGDLEQAEAYFRKALKVDGEQEKALYNLRLLDEWRNNLTD